MESIKVDDLKKLYHSKLYQNLVDDFSRLSSFKYLDLRDEIETLDILLKIDLKKFLFLKLTPEQLFEEFEKSKDLILRYTIKLQQYFESHPSNKEEYPKGEGPSENEKSKTIAILGISRTVFIQKFCECYFLSRNNNTETLKYLKHMRMPFPNEYLKQIIGIYKAVKEMD